MLPIVTVLAKNPILRRQVVRLVKKTVKLLVPLIVVAAVLVGVLIVVIGVGEGDASLTVEPAAGLNVSAAMLAAYQQTAVLRCAPETGDYYFAAAPGDAYFSEWSHVDWRLVAAIGHVESGDAAGRRIDVYGGVWPPIIGPPLNGTISGLRSIADTDKGRYDSYMGWDAAVGPLQFLPANVAAFGVDGNGDNLIDPQNIFDAAMSAAYYLCMHKSEIRAYNDSGEYETDVLERLVEITAAYPDPHPGWSMPAGMPVSWVTPFHMRNETGEVILLSDAVLRSTIHTLTQQLLADTLTSDQLAGMNANRFTTLLETQIVECDENSVCGWRVQAGLDDWLQPWMKEKFHEHGLIGVVAPHPTVVLAAADRSRQPRYQLPTLFDSDRLAWPVAVDALGVTDRYTPPAWWTWHTATTAEFWSASGAEVTIPTVNGVWVGWPASGEAVTDQTCGTVTDSDGWVWELCGLYEMPTVGDNVQAGNSVGRSNGEVTVKLFDPDGMLACPQALFARWVTDAVTPAEEHQAQQTRETQALQDAETQYAYELQQRLDAGVNTENVPLPLFVAPVIPNPLRDCLAESSL